MEGHLNLRIDTETLERVDGLAGAVKMRRSELVRSLLRHFVALQEADQRRLVGAPPPPPDAAR